MQSLKQVYFAQLGLDAISAADAQRRRAALERAYVLRSFEIDLFWKRATYFWGFQAGIFAAFGLILSGDGALFRPMGVLLAVAGVFTSLANLAAGRGSKFWQENWEKHIDMLEDEFEGRLHKTVWYGDRCCHPSVSKVNRNLGIALVVFWALAAIGTAILLMSGHSSNVKSTAIELVAEPSQVAVLVIGSLVVAFIAALSWGTALTSPKSRTVLRNGLEADGCESSKPVGPDEPVFFARHNPANEPTGN